MTTVELNPLVEVVGLNLENYGELIKNPGFQVGWMEINGGPREYFFSHWALANAPPWGGSPDVSRTSMVYGHYGDKPTLRIDGRTTEPRIGPVYSALLLSAPFRLRPGKSYSFTFSAIGDFMDAPAESAMPWAAHFLYLYDQDTGGYIRMLGGFFWGHGSATRVSEHRYAVTSSSTFVMDPAWGGERCGLLINPFVQVFSHFGFPIDLYFTPLSISLKRSRGG